MSRLGFRARAAVFLRAFAVQGTWNYRTLIGAGFAFALLPALRVIHRGDEGRLKEALGRHAEVFNSHPYLAPIALGAVAELEATGEDPRLIERLKAALRGSLGTLGDQVVWVGWRPVCLLLAIVLILAGAPWWLGVGGFLLVYNIGHLALRVWGFRLGLADPLRIGERLRAAPISRAPRVLARAGAFLLGLALPAVVIGTPLWSAGFGAIGVSWPWMIAAAAAAGLGIRFGARGREAVILALLAVVVLGTLYNLLA